MITATTQKTQVYGVQETIAELRKFEPEMINRARKDLKVAAEPMVASIKDYMPNQAPLRGMRHNGRTSWQPSNVKVTVKTSFAKRTFTREQSLVSIWVGGKKGSTGAAGLQIADMAGRVGKVRTSGVTREYQRQGVSRRHRLNGQGRAMIDYLNANWGRASRFVWRAANLHQQDVQISVMQTIDKLSSEVNRKLMVK